MVGVSFQALLGNGGALTGVQLIGVTNSSAPSTTWNFPVGWQAGDFLTVGLSGQTVGQPTPAGWTAHVPYAANLLAGWHRLLDGSESGSISVIANGYGYSGQMSLWRGVGAKIASVAYGSWTDTAGGNSAPSPRLITVSGNAPMLLIGHKFGIGGGGITVSMSPTEDGTLGFYNSYWKVNSPYKLYGAGSTPVNNTVSGGDDGTANGLMAGYFRFT